MSIHSDPKTGKFVRQHKLWTLKKWNDGYIDSRGRFRVYRPDYPGSYSLGYALRSHVVWWLKHKEVCSGNKFELHHKDGNRLNDHINNLERISHSVHMTIHRSTAQPLKCCHCNRTFHQPAWRLRQRETKYCSQACYHNHERSLKHRQSISQGLKKAYKEGRR